MKKETYNVTGMSCAACSASIEKTLNKIDGIKASVNLATEKVNVEFDENKYDFEKIKEVVESIGYDINQDKTINKEELYEESRSKLQKKLLISAIFSIFIHSGFFLFATEPFSSVFPSLLIQSDAHALLLYQDFHRFLLMYMCGLSPIQTEG